MIQFSPAANQLFSQLDSNQNGITARELKQLDKNHDGKITATEAPGLEKAELELINRALKSARTGTLDTVVFQRVSSAQVPQAANAPSEMSFPDKPTPGAEPAPGASAAPASTAPASTAPASYETPGKVMGVARGTGYYPANNAMEGGFKDKKGAPLHTLQDFLDGKAPYVSIAIDKRLYSHGTVQYGDSFRIPELEARYGRPIVFKAVDTGGAFTGKGFGRVDICTRSSAHSHDPAINGQLTLIRADS